MTQTSNRPRLTRDKSQAQTRERLIAAAWEKIAHQGLGGASVRDIAEAAGYSQGAFYSNFAHKEDVLLELMRRHMAAETAQLDGLLQHTKQEPAQAMAAIESWCKNLNQEVDWCMIALELQMYASRNASFAVACDGLYAAHRKALGRILAEVFEIFGKALPAPAEDIAASFMALAHGMALLRRPGAPDQTGRAILLYLRSMLAS